MDPDTFITAVYVLVDDLHSLNICGNGKKRRGRRPVLSESEAITLALLAQWHGAGSERAFVRFASREWRGYFPAVSQSAFNRRVRGLRDAISRLSPVIAGRMSAPGGAGIVYEAIDTTVVPLMRSCRGWRTRLFSPGQASVGRGGSDHRWEYGIKLAATVSASGCVSGFTAGPANTEDRWLAEAIFRLRHDPSAKEATARDLDGVLGPAHRNHGRRKGPAGPLWPRDGAGVKSRGPYLGDRGFRGKEWRRHWQAHYAAAVLTPSKEPEAVMSSRELKSRRQIVEQVFGILSGAFHLHFPRARTIQGLKARIAAKIAALNMMLLINRIYGRKPLSIFNPIA